MAEDWLSRVTIPDMYPRADDPFQPRAAGIPSTAPPPSLADSAILAPGVSEVVADIYQDWLTVPGARPNVYQRASNFQILADVFAQPLLNQPFQCDTMVINVPSTAANSVFFGYGNGITAASGLEVQPGLPIVIQPENVREQWELQRMLEIIASMIGHTLGFMSPGSFRAPRVVFNANEYYHIATAQTTFSVMLFHIPELQ